MSALGHKRTSQSIFVMSALTLKADMLLGTVIRKSLTSLLARCSKTAPRFQGEVVPFRG